MLDHKDERLRVKANFVLENLTGADVDFLSGPDHGPMHDAGIIRWKRWWYAHAEDYEVAYGEPFYPPAWGDLPD